MGSVLHVTGQSNAQSASSTSYYSCFIGEGSANVTESTRAVMARTAGTLSNVFCYVSAHSGTDSTLRVRVNAGNGNSAVTISGTGQFEDTSGTDSVDAGEEFDYSVVTGNGGSTIEGFSHLFVPSSGTVCYLVGGTTSTFNGTTDVFCSLARTISGHTTEANMQNTFGASATFQNAFVNVSSNSRSDQTSFVMRLNGVTGNIALTYAAAATGDVEDTTHTDAVADGDEVNWMWSQGGGSGNLGASALKVELSGTNTFQFVSGQSSSPSTQASGLTRFLFPAGSITNNIDDVEADKQVKSNLAFTWSDLYGYLSSYSLNSGNYQIKSRINGADGNMVVTWTGTGQQSDTSNTDSVSDNDELGLSSVTGGTSGSVLPRVITSLGTVAAGGGGRSTKNTRATRLGMELGMNIWMQ